MSDSRLEKFIYAICSMDVSDLPVPLSRIEKLWNCLITGETPDFEPQSRNEQYLMAMLGLYELDQLPIPLNRGEKLLYKIAVGETDLSDVPGYLSRYEELLKYLIENGGIGFEYVLYTLNQSLSTLYNTAEKPVKSAILKGNTLVNLYENNQKTTSSVATYNNEWITLNATGGYVRYFHSKSNMLKPSTKYLIIIDVKENTLQGSNSLQLNDYGVTEVVFNTNMSVSGSGIFKFISMTKDDLTNKTIDLRCLLASSNTSGLITFRVMFIEYQNGMENWDIPYFEGMQSVRMPVLTTTGKNLFDGKLKIGNIQSDSGQTYELAHMRITDFIKINANKTITISKLNNNDIDFRVEKVAYYDINKNFIGINGELFMFPKTSTPPTGAVYIRVVFCKGHWDTTATEEDFKTLQVQIEEGSTATTYEPYKTNILTVNEEVELRGIDDVQDTLNCLTGEVVERIGEIVLDGNEESWIMANDISKPNVIFYSTTTKQISKKDGVYKIISDKFSWPGEDLAHPSAPSIEGCYIAYDGNICISIYESKLNNLTVDGFREWLSQNPTTVQYHLATESIKTVDLTTVDQDGQPTKLKTFNDISYVEINADNIIPSVDMEVATKISETLSTLVLDHHDISETQNKLSQTIEEQTENTDATMMATTEIYEQTL